MESMGLHALSLGDEARCVSELAPCARRARTADAPHAQRAVGVGVVDVVVVVVVVVGRRPPAAGCRPPQGCVGKTSLTIRYCQDQFNANHITTIQASFLVKRLNVDGARVQLNIWVRVASVYVRVSCARTRARVGRRRAAAGHGRPGEVSRARSDLLPRRGRFVLFVCLFGERCGVLTRARHARDANHVPHRRATSLRHHQHGFV